MNPSVVTQAPPPGSLINYFYGNGGAGGSAHAVVGSSAPPPAPLSLGSSPPPPAAIPLTTSSGSSTGSGSDETKETKETTVYKDLKEQSGGGCILQAIDTSGSMSAHHPYQAARDSLHMFKKKCPSTMIEISGFTERNNIVIKRPMQVVSGCEHLARKEFFIEGGTHLYDVVRHYHDRIVAGDMLKRGPVSLMILTDGEDMGSTTTQGQAHALVADLKSRGVYCTAIVPTHLRQSIITKLGFDEDKVIVFEASNPASMADAMSSGSSGVASHSSSGGGGYSMPAIASLKLGSCSSGGSGKSKP